MPKVKAVTLAAGSDDSVVLTVDQPVGMTFEMHAAGPLGKADVVAGVICNDGSASLFTQPVKVVASGLAGITIVPGEPQLPSDLPPE